MPGARRDQLERRVRSLPERHGGRRVLIVIAVVVLLGFGLRAVYAVEGTDLPLPDSVGYTKIADSLYQDGRWGPPELERRNTYSPGTPLFAAGIYYATGGIKPVLVRFVIALLGAATVLLAYLIGRRLGGPIAGVIGAVPVAIYPALLEYHRMLMTEPLGAFTLAAAVLAFLWADEREGALPWALPGFLLGLTALIRPEYLLFGALFAVLLLVRSARRGGWAPGAAAAALMVAAFALPIVPWTVRNVIVLDRFVPISTGGGQALYIGTYVPAYLGGAGTTHSRVLADLERRYPDLEAAVRKRYPNFPADKKIILGQALEVVAKRRYPDLPPDAGLTKLGRHDLFHYLASEPIDFGHAVGTKVWDMWKTGFYSGNHPTMGRAWWIAFHALLVMLALAGLVLLVGDRRWEAWVMAIPIGGITVIGAVFLASPRRVMILVPLLGALAGVAAVRLVRSAR